MSSSVAPTPCDKNQIRNPETGRCVLINGVIGSKILGTNVPNSPKTPAKTESKKYSNATPKLPSKYVSFKLPRILFDPKLFGKAPLRYETVQLAVSEENRPNVFGVQKNLPEALTGWFAKQAQYINKLSMDDFLTISAYANNSQKWLGKYQSSATVVASPKRYYKEYLGSGIGYAVPLFPQLRKLVDFGEVPVKKLTRSLKVFGDKDLKNDVKIFADKSKPMRTRYQAFGEISKNLSQFAWEAALNDFELDLQRIILQAPPIDKTVTVFRGAINAYMKLNKPTIVKQFSSTAYATTQALSFGKEGFHRIELPPGTRALAMAIVNPWNVAGEDEILLPMNSEYVPKVNAPVRRWVLPNRVSRYSRNENIEQVNTASNFVVKTPK